MGTARFWHRGLAHMKKLCDVFAKNFSHLSTYLRVFWLTGIACTLIPILVGWTLMRYDNSFLCEYKVLLDYKSSFTNENYDVIFFGDSSCLMGVSPKIIEKETGLKVLNLGTYGGTGIIGYEAILRSYLKSNNPPKLIIYYISPSIPNMYSVKTFEQIFSYIKLASIDLFIENLGEYNPLQIPSALITYLTDKITPTTTKEQLKQLYMELEEFKGFQNKENNTGKMKETEKINSRYKYGDYFNTPHDPRKKIMKLVSHFKSDKTDVIIYLAPMPETEEAFNYFKETYQEIISNKPYTLKNENFSDYTHLNYQGAMINSKKVASFLKEILNL